MSGFSLGRIDPRTATRGSVLIAIWVTIVVAASLLLRASVPIWILNTDEILFARSAWSLLHHAWLGPFDQFTLSKGPAFPAFIALCYLVGVPLLIGEQLVHLAAAGAAAYAVMRITHSRGASVVAFTTLALDPSFFGAAASRVLRDDWYASVCLLLFSVVVVATTFEQLHTKSRRRRIIYVLASGLVLGVLLATYWLTREERPWLLPVLALAMILPALRGWSRLRRRTRGEAWTGDKLPRIAVRVARPYALAMLLGIAVFVGLLASVSYMNLRHYGAALTNDVTEGQFPRAYGLWESVQAGPVRPYVPISHAQRMAVYRVSSAARELEAPLEGSLSWWLAVGGCAAYKVCDDFAAGWLLWALRDAVAESGHSGSEADAQAFFSKLAGQIASGCSSGALKCGWQLPAPLPPLSSISIGSLAASFWTGSTLLATNDLADQMRGNSVLTPQGWLLFRGVIRGLPPTLAAQNAQEAAAIPTSSAGWWSLNGVYTLATLLGLPLACCGYALALWRRRSGSGAAVCVGLTAGLAVILHTALLALVDSTSFSAFGRSVYPLPGTSFLWLFLVLGVWLLQHTLRRQVDLASARPDLGAPQVPGVAGVGHKLAWLIKPR
jgi:hypothetical protein